MNKSSNFIKVNGKKFPAPKRGLDMTVSTAVNAARNANNKVVGQKIGRDNYKIGSCEWAWLDADTWSAILKEFDEHFYSTVEFFDMVNNTRRTLTMYCGDRSAQPYWVNSDGTVKTYKDCKMNLIDTGW